MPPARVKVSLRQQRAGAALQMPFLCKEHDACCPGDTKNSKRPRTFAGSEAANLGGTGFPPAGLLGVSSRRLLNDARSGKAFLTMTCMSEDFRQYLQGRRLPQRVAREAAHRPPPGKKREMLLRQARASEMAVQIDRWISSPGLRRPE
jgi:hypothetical protein